MLDKTAIPIQSRDVVVRKESEGMLLFQIRTDEMYFISNSGFELLRLCDGSLTITQIEEVFTKDLSQLEKFECCQQIERLMVNLADRKVIELWR